MFLNKTIKQLADAIYLSVQLQSKYEKKLLRCQNYRANTISQWKSQTGLGRYTTNKILEALNILDAPTIRSLIVSTLNNRPDIFESQNCYVTALGKYGKSGDVIAYEYSKCAPRNSVVINPSQIPSLPENSRIIFVDDLIGTGRQSAEYILNKLNLTLNPSHRPCVFTICGTKNGIDYLVKETGFEVVCGKYLDIEDDYYHPLNKHFSRNEKMLFRQLDLRLGDNTYGIGLLLAFFYSVPNNTMQFIWKDGREWVDQRGRKHKWKALIPRKY